MTDLDPALAAVLRDADQFLSLAQRAAEIEARGVGGVGE